MKINYNRLLNVTKKKLEKIKEYEGTEIIYGTNGVNGKFYIQLTYSGEEEADIGILDNVDEFSIVDELAELLSDDLGLQAVRYDF